MDCNGTCIFIGAGMRVLGVGMPLRLLFMALDRCVGRLAFIYYYDEYLYSIETDFAVRGRYALALLRLLPRWTELRVREVRVGEGCLASLARGENEVVEIALF